MSVVSSWKKGESHRTVHQGDSHSRKNHKHMDWQKRATHAVSSRLELHDPIAIYVYSGHAEKDPCANMYRYDQEAAHRGLHYFADSEDGRNFQIWVPKAKADLAKQVLDGAMRG